MFSSRKSCKPLAVTQVSNNKMLSSPVRSFFCWSSRQFWSTSDKCWKKKGPSLELKRTDKCGIKYRTNPQTFTFPWLRNFGHRTSCLLQKAAVCWAITWALQRDGRLFQSTPMHKEVFLWTLLCLMAFKTCRERGPSPEVASRFQMESWSFLFLTSSPQIAEKETWSDLVSAPDDPEMGNPFGRVTHSWVTSTSSYFGSRPFKLISASWLMA